MTHHNPDLNAVNELRNLRHGLQIYEAIAVATNDAHGALDTMLGSSDPDTACRALQERFGFTEPQAVAVMEMQFRLVTATGRAVIEQQRQDLAARLKVLEADVGGA